jgi:hypothetical protein
VSAAAEAHRQRALLAALWQASDVDALPVLQQAGERAAQGLSAYRANAGALAERALGAVFPTVQAMLGDDDFKHLAREFWHARPPERGDMGEWGDEFPGWLEAHGAFTEWPYLGDCARLDLSVHRCERAEDAELNGASFALLESIDPTQLRIELMPGTAALPSAWPLATIHRAHLLQEAGNVDGAAAAFADVRVALAAQRGEAVVVARAGWRAQVHAVDVPTLGWTQSLLSGVPLALALVQAGEGFDFTTWLTWVLREGGVKEVQRIGD